MMPSARSSSRQVSARATEADFVALLRHCHSFQRPILTPIDAAAAPPAPPSASPSVEARTATKQPGVLSLALSSALWTLRTAAALAAWLALLAVSLAAVGFIGTAAAIWVANDGGY